MRPAVVWARLLLQSIIIHQKRRHFFNFRTTLHLHQWHAVTSSSSPVFRWWLRGHCSSITPALRPSFAHSFLFSFPSTLLFIVLHLFSACSPPSPVSPRNLLSLLKYSWRLDLRGSRRVALIYVRLASLLTRWLDVRYGIGGWTRPERSSEEAALGGRCDRMEELTDRLSLGQIAPFPSSFVVSAPYVASLALSSPPPPFSSSSSIYYRSQRSWMQMAPVHGLGRPVWQIFYIPDLIRWLWGCTSMSPFPSLSKGRKTFMVWSKSGRITWIFNI